MDWLLSAAAGYHTNEDPMPDSQTQFLLGKDNCIGQYHVLKCDHTVDVGSSPYSTVCSVNCQNPVGLDMRDPPHDCNICKPQGCSDRGHLLQCGHFVDNIKPAFPQEHLKKGDENDEERAGLYCTPACKEPQEPVQRSARRCYKCETWEIEDRLLPFVFMLQEKFVELGAHHSGLYRADFNAMKLRGEIKALSQAATQQCGLEVWKLLECTGPITFARHVTRRNDILHSPSNRTYNRNADIPDSDLEHQLLELKRVIEDWTLVKLATSFNVKISKRLSTPKNDVSQPLIEKLRAIVRHDNIPSVPVSSQNPTSLYSTDPISLQDPRYDVSQFLSHEISPISSGSPVYSNYSTGTQTAGYTIAVPESRAIRRPRTIQVKSSNHHYSQPLQSPGPIIKPEDLPPWDFDLIQRSQDPTHSVEDQAAAEDATAAFINRNILADQPKPQAPLNHAKSSKVPSGFTVKVYKEVKTRIKNAVAADWKNLWTPGRVKLLTGDSSFSSLGELQSTLSNLVARSIHLARFIDWACYAERSYSSILNFTVERNTCLGTMADSELKDCFDDLPQDFHSVLERIFVLLTADPRWYKSLVTNHKKLWKAILYDSLSLNDVRRLEQVFYVSDIKNSGLGEASISERYVSGDSEGFLIQDPAHGSEVNEERDSEHISQSTDSSASASSDGHTKDRVTSAIELIKADDPTFFDRIGPDKVSRVAPKTIPQKHEHSSRETSPFPVVTLSENKSQRQASWEYPAHDAPKVYIPYRKPPEPFNEHPDPLSHPTEAHFEQATKYQPIRTAYSPAWAPGPPSSDNGSSNQINKDQDFSDVGMYDISERLLNAGISPVKSRTSSTQYMKSIDEDIDEYEGIGQSAPVDDTTLDKELATLDREIAALEAVYEDLLDTESSETLVQASGEQVTDNTSSIQSHQSFEIPESDGEWFQSNESTTNGDGSNQEKKDSKPGVEVFNFANTDLRELYSRKRSSDSASSKQKRVAFASSWKDKMGRPKNPSLD